MLDINGPAHIFYEAKESGVAMALHFVSLDHHTEIKTSAGLYFNRLEFFESIELQAGDIVFIPGLDYHLISDKNFVKLIRPFLNWVTEQYQKGVHICSICTGSFILAETGILNGQTATTHWKYFERFFEKFPKINLLKDRLFVSSKNVHSSAGVASGIDLSLYLLEQFYGTKLAVDIAKEVVIYFRRSASDPQLSVFLQYRNHLDHRIHNAQDYLINHLKEAPTAEDLADHVHMSKRNLTRLFKKTCGITIGGYLEKIRVEKAIALLAKKNKVDFVALQCGLKSTNQLRTILKKHQDVLPTEITPLSK
ncbi:DJ-1/PfpI family protein [Croceitalea sp. MTPC5]|nr:DJ-1/PfpI family protein [Croceitalea sp. MTPC5]